MNFPMIGARRLLDWRSLEAWHIIETAIEAENLVAPDSAHHGDVKCVAS